MQCGGDQLRRWRSKLAEVGQARDETRRRMGTIRGNGLKRRGLRRIYQRGRMRADLIAMLFFWRRDIVFGEIDRAPERRQADPPPDR